jgi:hypothetical protein
MLAGVWLNSVQFVRDGHIFGHSQDYWDTGVIYEKIPVMGAVIRWIKNKF